ncbi:NAD(+) diphosphatase [Leptothoe spongobia]|uniref:NAD-capped RNA hydrolase NudC n=1 Tax=Leptothoe spongobia TAU-MAC 1115 TaxID=1967444 RepID=A0A947DHX8_9CYAN|nr:NAD(+) diphosphatase [Leptothoe spongobia]MBT9317252.1 NAD(+) diphosphatase [Leptothoe spongobia TAU-MAC 1115]
MRELLAPDMQSGMNPFGVPPAFVPGVDPAEAPEGLGWWFGFCGSQMLVITGNELQGESDVGVPQVVSLDKLGINVVRSQYLGTLENRPCYAAQLPTDLDLPPELALKHLRGLYGQLDDTFFAIAGRATQLVEWDRTHQYCGSCATPMEQSIHERVKHCPQCDLRQYPRLSPAVIMLVSRGPEILLAHAPRFRDGMYSILAGFVEPGESLEETVAREVREEVGIEVKDIRYFGSQPWPFPNSLMIGFTARYASGNIVIDPTEIETADWFTKDNLPPVPGKLSIARKLIDWFVEQAAV